MIKNFSITGLAVVLAVALSVGMGIAAPVPDNPSTPPAASNDTKQPAAPSTADAAKSDLAHMVSLFKGASTLTYSSTVAVMTAPGSAPQTIDLSVSIQRPNLIKVELDQQGKMVGLAVSDGKSSYGFDAAGNRYTKTSAGSATGPDAIVQALMPAGQILNSTASEVLFSPGLALFLTPSAFDLSANPSPGTVSISDVPDMIDGTAVSHITQTMSRAGNSASVHIYLDKTTGLPKRFAEDITENGKSMEVIREDFHKIDVGAASLDASNFSWTPPTGAKVFKAPAPTEEAAPKLANGAKAPDFTVLTLSGKPVHLSDYKGKVIVLDFWATWCGPCQMSLPHTDALAKIYRTKGVVFLPVCTSDDKASFQSWVHKHKTMTMSFYFDPAAKNVQNSFSYKLYKVESIPTQFVIGKDGKIAQGFIGYDPDGDPGEKGLRQALDKALAAN